LHIAGGRTSFVSRLTSVSDVIFIIINILKKAGVDMTSPEPINKTIELFNSLVDQFEKLILE
jgi:hypothetical protein